MKKVLFVLLTAFMILSTGCSSKSSDNPKDLLTKAYDNVMKMESLTGDMSVNVKVGEGLTLSIPVNMDIRVRQNDLWTQDDDEAYVKTEMTLLGQSTVSETWTKNGKVYMDVAGMKSVSDAPETAKEMSATERADMIISAVLSVQHTAKHPALSARMCRHSHPSGAL